MIWRSGRGIEVVLRGQPASVSDAGPSGARRAHVWLAVALAALCTVAVAAPDASAARGLRTGFIDFEYLGADRNRWFDITVETNADIVRITPDWRANVGDDPPANPRDPADPAYDFFGLDQVVREAHARGLQVLFTVGFAPGWAEGANPPPGVPSGTWKPDPKAYGDYAHALASRYSGAFPDPAVPGQALPRVSFFEVWNEPNLPEFLNPQWEGRRAASPVLYTELLNALYDGVKAVHADNLVIGPALAPYGDPPGGERVRPLKFLRDLFCLKGKKKPKPKKGCSGDRAPRFDVLSHHPVNLVGGPSAHASHPDDVSSGDLDRLTPVLRAAQKAGHYKPGGRKPIWVTEFFWYSDPPTSGASFARPPDVQARFIQESLYLWWRAGAEVAINFLIRDMNAPSGFTFGTGVLFADDTRKPAFEAFRFPFVVDRTSKGKVFVWGKAPSTGTAEIQQQVSGDWQTVKQLSVTDGGVFTTKLKLRGGATLRAIIGSDTSLPWSLGR